MKFTSGLAATLFGTAAIALVQTHQPVLAKSARQVATTAKKNHGVDSGAGSRLRGDY
jgi:hypothetical protein